VPLNSRAAAPLGGCSGELGDPLAGLLTGKTPSLH